MRNVIIDFKRIFDTKLHRQFPHATPALFLSVQSALFPNGDDGVAFKVQGEMYEIHYDGVRLCFVKTYSLPEEGLSMKVMSAACRKVTGEVYGVKAILGNTSVRRKILRQCFNY